MLIVLYIGLGIVLWVGTGVGVALWKLPTWWEIEKYDSGEVKFRVGASFFVGPFVLLFYAFNDLVNTMANSRNPQTKIQKAQEAAAAARLKEREAKANIVRLELANEQLRRELREKGIET